jgi:glyoxylase-like metal-dependent hydrolase (beta-lactamase superfamily II)
MIKVPRQQIPGVYHRRVGDIVVTAISDGFLDGTLDVLRNITQEGARQILDESFRPARRTAVNAFLVYSAGRLALIETGSGNYLQPTAGKAIANIRAAGVDPADIEVVLLTHMHPDHSAGLTDMATGRRNFPNAELVVHENEPRHWFDDAKMAAATERARSTSSAPASKPPPTGTACGCSERVRSFPASPRSHATATPPDTQRS